jgi:hypothetical protein
MILWTGRRLQARAQPRTYYALVGASAFLADLKALNDRPLPSTRPIGRVLQRYDTKLLAGSVVAGESGDTRAGPSGSS